MKDADIVSGYDRGADDYVVKPFAFPVLAARINAVLRRYAYGPGPIRDTFKVAGMELDPVARTIKIDGKQAALTRKEFDLLLLLLEKKGRVVSAPFILETVWGYDLCINNNPHTVETHISSLRKKLGVKLAARILNISGFGYKLE